MPGLSIAQRGSTLPEALAALLVVGAGLPALGLLQLEALRTLSEAGWQFAAATAAADAAESLRAGIPEASLARAPLTGLPPSARLYLAAGGGSVPAMLRVRVEWPGHDAAPAAFELGVSR